MTRNQLMYHSNLETERSNRARELETHRSNIATEVETRRSNLAKESETYRSNVANEKNQRLKTWVSAGTSLLNSAANTGGNVMAAMIKAIA